MNFISTLLFSVMLFLLSGCGSADYPLVYKVDIGQGNILESEQVDKLKVGMNKEQVTFLLGSPLLIDAFHDNRWDYYYSFKPGRGPKETAHLIVNFTADKVSHIRQLTG